MEANTVVARQSAKATARSRKIMVALGILALLCGVLGAQFYLRHQPETLDSRLRGDMEEATSALEERLATVPDDKKIPLLRKYAVDESPGLRYAAVDALGTLKGKEVADQIEAAMTDSSSIVRQRAIEVLPNVDKERGLHLLLAALADNDLWIREAAVSQITSLSGKSKGVQNKSVDQRAIPMLLHALDDPSPNVPKIAIAALHHLSGKDWTYRMGAPPAAQKAVLDKWHQWGNGWVAQNTSRLSLANYLNIPAISPVRTDTAPDFHLTDIDGHSISRDSQKGRLTLLNFWGSWCPPCQMEVPDLIKMDTNYRTRGLDIIGVGLSEKGDSLRTWCKAHGVAYRQVLDNNSITKDYGDIHEVPVSILIDREGKIRNRWDGERDFDTFRAAVERLL